MIKHHLEMIFLLIFCILLKPTNSVTQNLTNIVLLGQNSDYFKHFNNNLIQSERNGKFLFDTLFGLESTNSNDEAADDDEDDEPNHVKTCDCGKIQ